MRNKTELTEANRQYAALFTKPAIRQICSGYGVKLVVYSVDDEEIVSWIE